jgi:hypothetical protein
MLDVDHLFQAYQDHPGITSSHRSNAELLISRVNTLLARCLRTGQVDLETNPKTGTLISGEKNGGWRPQDCPIGAPNSSHKTGQGVDLYDPDGDIDNCLMEHQNILVECGLYIEHPSATRGWSHLTTRPPKSHNRVFYP